MNTHGKSQTMPPTPEADEELDLRGVICPYNFVKTKLKLETFARWSCSNLQAAFEPPCRRFTPCSETGEWRWHGTSQSPVRRSSVGRQRSCCEGRPRVPVEERSHSWWRETDAEHNEEQETDGKSVTDRSVSGS